MDTGIEHGTVTVLIGKDGFEVTTYRVDGLYEDGRHPKEVTFTSRLEEDLKRRDFTINAMAYNFRGCTSDSARSTFFCAAGISNRAGDRRSDQKSGSESGKDQCRADSGRAGKTAGIRSSGADSGCL